MICVLIRDALMRCTAIDGIRKYYIDTVAVWNDKKKWNDSQATARVLCAFWFVDMFVRCDGRLKCNMKKSINKCGARQRSERMCTNVQVSKFEVHLTLVSAESSLYFDRNYKMYCDLVFCCNTHKVHGIRLAFAIILIKEAALCLAHFHIYMKRAIEWNVFTVWVHPLHIHRENLYKTCVSPNHARAHWHIQYDSPLSPFLSYLTIFFGWKMRFPVIYCKIK